MGTRHYQTVIDKAGTTKVAQYGQWDGYPCGQGLAILSFLKTADLENYQHQLSLVRDITEEESDSIDANKNWERDYPHLSRDCGSAIHQLIADGKVSFVSLMDRKEASKSCEGFYTIDFSKGIFTTEYYKTKVDYPLASLPTDEEYLKNFDSE